MSWRRASPTSSGAACRTRSCSPLAAKGTLQQPGRAGRAGEADAQGPEGRALADNFAGQWLQLRNLSNVSPDTQRFPDFNDATARSR